MVKIPFCLSVTFDAKPYQRWKHFGWNITPHGFWTHCPNFVSRRVINGPSRLIFLIEIFHLCRGVVQLRRDNALHHISHIEIFCNNCWAVARNAFILTFKVIKKSNEYQRHVVNKGRTDELALNTIGIHLCFTSKKLKIIVLWNAIRDGTTYDWWRRIFRGLHR